MNTNQNRESARIYPFPAGGRAALGEKRGQEINKNSLVSPGFERINEAACSACWYHEAAIREAAERGLDH